MSLTDLMSGVNLTIFPEIALGIFLVVFLAVALRVYGRGRPDRFDHLAALPLQDSAPGEARALSAERPQP